MSNNQALLDPNCQHCMMMPMCSEQAKEVCKHQQTPVVTHTHELKRREILYSYRDDFKCLFAVNYGALKTFHIDMNGQERIHQFYLPGEIIGLEAIHVGHHPYSAIALTSSSVCEIPFDNLTNFIAATPNLQKQLFNALSHRINVSHYVTASTAEQRLAGFLQDVCQRLHHHDATAAFELPMSRYDIGNYLGLAPETVSRLFTRFQQAALIQVQNKKIHIIDRNKLQWIAQEGMNA